MKFINIFILSIALISFSLSAGAQTETKTGSVKQLQTNVAEQDTLTFTVYGMDCPGCAGGLEKQVNKIPSVKESHANWVKQELKVVVKEDSLLDLGELEKRVKKANFTLQTDKNKK